MKQGDFHLPHAFTCKSFARSGKFPTVDGMPLRKEWQLSFLWGKYFFSSLLMSLLVKFLPLHRLKTGKLLFILLLQFLLKFLNAVIGHSELILNLNISIFSFKLFLELLRLNIILFLLFFTSIHVRSEFLSKEEDFSHTISPILKHPKKQIEHAAQIDFLS